MDIKQIAKAGALHINGQISLTELCTMLGESGVHVSTLNKSSRRITVCMDVDCSVECGTDNPIPYTVWADVTIPESIITKVS